MSLVLGLRARGVVQAVQESEFLTAIPLPAFIVGEEDRIELANGAAQVLMGEGMVGRNVALAFRAPELLQAISETLDKTAHKTVSIRVGHDLRYRATVSALTSGETRRALCVLQDLTAEAHAQLIRRDFVANVSHELRTPLTALMGFIETLRGAAKSDPVARDRFLAIMEREAGRMNRLVRDLLHLSRVEAEERMRPRDVVDLTSILRSAVANLQSTAAERDCVIMLENADHEVKVHADDDQLTQVFLNLIENAIKYGARGAQVLVQLETSPNGVVVRVVDQGEGIDAIHLPRLTERFYRIDSHRSRAEGGTGLGLAIVKHIVSRHKGRLTITSEKGKGSTFAVSLPRV